LLVALSVQDIQEGVVRWDYLHPYTIARAPSGYCTHCRPDLGCGVYEHRPAVCRGYDCRADKRIWADFEAGTLSDELLPARAAPPG
jgi:Fe-S-cluster containining protein